MSSVVMEFTLSLLRRDVCKRIKHTVSGLLYVKKASELFINIFKMRYDLSDVFDNYFTSNSKNLV